MKLVHFLASVATGFAILATVGSTSASAADFNLSGSLVKGATFSGTYSFSGLAPTIGSPVTIPTFLIKVADTSGTTFDTFNSSVSNEIAEVFEFDSPSFTFDVLEFDNHNNSSTLSINFPLGFQGTGIITRNESNVGEFNFPSNSDIIAAATSTPVVTQAVPEPSTIIGTLAAGVGLMAMRLKKSKKQKVSEAA